MMAARGWARLPLCSVDCVCARAVWWIISSGAVRFSRWGWGSWPA